MMDIDACRDWLATDEGWIKRTYGGLWCDTAKRWLYCDDGPVWTEDASVGSFLKACQHYHPIDATLDAAAAAMPEGWWWERDKRRKVWRAGTNDSDAWKLCCEDTGDELADRFNLAVLVREKIKEAK